MTDERIERVQDLIGYVATDTDIAPRLWKDADKALTSLQQELERLRHRIAVVEADDAEARRLLEEYAAENERLCRIEEESESLRDEAERAKAKRDAALMVAAGLRRIEEAATGYVLTLDHGDLYEDPERAAVEALDALRAALDQGTRSMYRFSSGSGSTPPGNHG